MTENQPTTTSEVSFEDLNAGFSFTPPEENEKEDSKETTDFNFIPPTDEVKEDVETEVTVEVKEEPKVLEFKAENNFYSNLIKKKIEKGLWEDIRVQDGDSEIVISEFENATEEDYLKFEEDQKALKDADSKEKNISIEKVTPERKKILEIVANGGNLEEIFQNAQQLKKPFDEADGWDLDNEKHQESVVYQHYQSLGNSPSRAAILVEADKKEFLLDSMAKEVVDFHQKAFSENLDNINKQLIEESKTESENIKKFGQDLTKAYKDLGVPEADAKKYVIIATKEIDGEFEADILFNSIMKDPIQAAELIFFMKERDKYKRTQSINTKVATQISNLRTVQRIQKDTTQSSKKEDEKPSGFSFNAK